MEEERGSGIDGERGIFSHKEGVIDQIGLVGIEMPAAGNGITKDAHHILSPGRQGHFLAHAVGHKLQAVLDQGRFVLLHLVQTGLDEDINRVVAADLYILELIAANAVNIEVEMPLAGEACHLDR